MFNPDSSSARAEMLWPVEELFALVEQLEAQVAKARGPVSECMIAHF